MWMVIRKKHSLTQKKGSNEMNCLHLSKIQDSFREIEKVSEDINQENINNA